MSKRLFNLALTGAVIAGIAACKPAPPPSPAAPPPPVQAAKENKESDEVVLGGDPADTLLKAGQIAPDFKLTLKGGATFTLKGALAKNRVVLVNFWSVT